MEGEGVVEGCDGDVAAVEDEGPVDIGVDAGPVVEASVGGLAGRGVADGAWAEAGAGTVAYGCVEGGSDDADVKGLVGGCEAFDMAKMGEC